MRVPFSRRDQSVAVFAALPPNAGHRFPSADRNSARSGSIRCPVGNAERDGDTDRSPRRRRQARYWGRSLRCQSCQPSPTYRGGDDFEHPSVPISADKRRRGAAWRGTSACSGLLKSGFILIRAPAAYWFAFTALAGQSVPRRSIAKVRTESFLKLS